VNFGPARRPKPNPHPWPGTMRSFDPEAGLGPCETADCDRAARATCDVCGGQHCLWHTDHPEHESATDDAATASQR
jgi:hypothetical protein